MRRTAASQANTTRKRKDPIKKLAGYELAPFNDDKHEITSHGERAEDRSNRLNSRCPRTCWLCKNRSHVPVCDDSECRMATRTRGISAVSGESDATDVQEGSVACRPALSRSVGGGTSRSWHTSACSNAHRHSARSAHCKSGDPQNNTSLAIWLSAYARYRVPYTYVAASSTCHCRLGLAR